MGGWVKAHNCNLSSSEGSELKHCNPQQCRPTNNRGRAVYQSFRQCTCTFTVTLNFMAFFLHLVNMDLSDDETMFDNEVSETMLEVQLADSDLDDFVNTLLYLFIELL